MQLNVYVSKDKQGLLEELNDASKRTGRAKNELVLEALERYLRAEKPQWRTFDLGEFEMPSRAEIYEEYLDHKMGLDAPGL